MRVTSASVAYSTIGQSNPSHVTLATPYRYKGRPGWPFDPDSRDDGGKIEAPKGGALARQAERERNLATFTAAREEGLDVEAAGRRAGVARKTAYRYEKERKDRLEQEAPGA
jgi:hypothetical protein